MPSLRHREFYHGRHCSRFKTRKGIEYEPIDKKIGRQSRKIPTKDCIQDTTKYNFICTQCGHEYEIDHLGQFHL